MSAPEQGDRPVPQAARVAADANGPRSDYDDIKVGRSLGTMEWTPDRASIELQCHVDQDFDPWYSLTSPFGGVIAPPQLQYRPPRWLLSRNYNIRGLFYRWEIANVAPIRPDVTLTIRGRIADKYVRHEREFVVYEVEALDPDGDVVFRTRRTHVLDAIRSDAPREGTGIDSGIKHERL